MLLVSKSAVDFYYHPSNADFPALCSDVAFELPANLVCKLAGPGRFIPVLSFLFGLFSFVSLIRFGFCALQKS